MEKTRGSVGAIKEVLKVGKRINIKEMAAISDMAVEAGGYLAYVDGDDDWCGNGRIFTKWPPKRHDAFVKLLEALVERQINFEVLINGIPGPEDVVINVSRQIGRNVRV